MTPTERLIEAWIRWEQSPGSERTAAAVEDAIHAAGLPGCASHEHVATCRRGGMSIPDAVQTICNDDTSEAA